jgi:FKBP-type peptidyl-prolyl cis-trans isomerase 2
MAGKTVIFHIKVMDVRDATTAEQANGVDAMAMPILH